MIVEFLSRDSLSVICNIAISTTGVIDLCGDDIHLEAGAHEVHSHYFTITTPTRLYEISAPTEAVRANWIAVLSKLINGIGAAASEKPPGEKRLVNGRDVGAMLGAEDLLKCPLSKEWLRDPVICSDGFTYEREVRHHSSVNHVDISQRGY